MLLGGEPFICVAPIDPTRNRSACEVDDSAAKRHQHGSYHSRRGDNSRPRAHGFTADRLTRRASPVIVSGSLLLRQPQVACARLMRPRRKAFAVLIQIGNWIR